MNDINSIKEVIDMPIITRGELWFFCIFSFLILSVIGFWLFNKYLKKYFFKEKDLIKEEVIEIDYNDKIKKKFEKAKLLLKRGEYKKFHLKISELLRFYFDKKYHCNALMMTSTEINKIDVLSNWQKEKIKIFFDKNNLAKFANVTQKKEIAEEVLKITEEIIELK